MIHLQKGKIEDVQLCFGKDYQEIEEIEEFYDTCESSHVELKVDPSLEQNQIQWSSVTRKKDSKKKKTKKNAKASNMGILETSLLSIEEEELNRTAYMEIQTSTVKLNSFYFNREMFNMFSTLNEITQFILAKKHPTAKNILILEDIKDIFVAKHIRNAITMTQQNPNPAQMVPFEFDETTAIIHQAEDLQPLESVKDHAKRSSLQGGDADIQDWLCEIGIKYDIDYHFTFGRKETQDYLISCLQTTVKSKYKKDIGIYDQKSKEFSELANAEGLTGYYEQQWVAMLMSINLVSEKKAVAIAKQFKSLKSLMNAYQNVCCSEKERENLLSTVLYKGEKGATEKNLGKAISKKVHQILVLDDPGSIIS